MGTAIKLIPASELYYGRFYDVECESCGDKWTEWVMWTEGICYLDALDAVIAKHRREKGCE